MSNKIKEKTEELHEDFKLYATTFELLSGLFVEITEELRNGEKRDDEALGRATVLMHALLAPTKDFMENELQELENDLEGIVDDKKINFLKMVEGKVRTMTALMMLLKDNVEKLHTTMCEEVNNND